jgi:hypothetical protein
VTGPYTAPVPALPLDLQDAFRDYTLGPSLIRQAINGTEPGRLNRAGAGGWSTRDVLVHLGDLEVVGALSFRAVIASLGGDEAQLPRIDQDLWKRKLGYIWRDPEAALSLFRSLRFANAEILQNADRAAWARTAVRDGAPVTMADLLREAVAHDREHQAQIEALLEAAGATGRG